MFKLMFTVVLLVAVGIPSAHGHLILYEHKNHNGNEWRMEVHGCTNVWPEANDRATSVNTEGDCYILFEHGDCQGRAMRVAPGVGCHSKMQDCNFNDIVSSARPC